MVLGSPSLLTARARDSAECGNLLYLKEHELVDLRGSFLCAKRDLDIVCAGAKHYNGLESRVWSHGLKCKTGSKSPVTVLESTGPGEDSTGAGAERELGFDPQPKAELAQGEYKGAREVLARHVHTAEPRGGPGGC